MVPSAARACPTAIDDTAFEIAYLLRTGEFPEDDTMRQACGNIALVMASLKSYGRIYTMGVYNPRSSKCYTIASVHTNWTVYIAKRLPEHLLLRSNIYEAVIEAGSGVPITVTIPAYKPLEVVLELPAGAKGVEGHPVQVCATSTEPVGPGTPLPAAPTLKSVASKPVPKKKPASRKPGASRKKSPAAARRSVCGPEVVFQCRACTALYRSPVNAARCSATHPPPGSRLTRRTYNAAAVIEFWDSLSYGARMDLLDPIVPMMSTEIVNQTGADLLEMMETQACENLLLVMVHKQPETLPVDALVSEDFGAEMCYRVIDAIIKAMEAAAAAREQALLDELAAEAAAAEAREASRREAREAKRVAMEAKRHQKTLERLANDDAFFRAFLPNCMHWYLDDETD